ANASSASRRRMTSIRRDRRVSTQPWGRRHTVPADRADLPDIRQSRNLHDERYGLQWRSGCPEIDLQPPGDSGAPALKRETSLLAECRSAARPVMKRAPT